MDIFLPIHLNENFAQMTLNRVFSDFVFKIRLIRLGLSFQRTKIQYLYLNSQPTDS